MTRRRFGLGARARGGFTLAEVLVATFVLSIGLLAVATGFQYATSGVETGKGETQATFLAEQRLEVLKNLALTSWGSATLTAGTTNEAYGAIAGAPLYRRTTVIVDDPNAASPGQPCDANCKLVTVSVFYRPVTSRGDLSQERQVTVVVMLVPRT
ncbi:MAG: hypothetical protein A3E31_10560 [Candidatus Rokubacteria bacterium RIFCSPHIGHO2_12_FULL_73_22]|uniref:Prepilin-type N-terminal cleavage/methylation domain-containing protein n=1 Tax=uncultured bacterium Rifle_16ft_4_minimus_37862 TaxID=1665157 RepID=A0A0H4T978_9BACT|nr:hypothetical protein [uncultured bacterium Rifle_16ft_4_minimus_37862]OGL01901.1 MAG: hypothetical protein A3D33_02210 [Candidatus Rokubacteria bacterium RIFCSPHIGHO2_02_FULL_73_26]OGL02913.1 MAG: hypothetical protein A3E31_10560 [Candidatus Rokubacteria bacterium RIFCSPHIGHO2_12_FULL_73_22]OGL12594.1 MAG: hypothetical protein A3I14_02395 [Candidatus Rokubacteria bacterium RIFCSPLOWO2_02_FULL_73_56]OGL20876.1 MAG: hypothetical protein A3G44_16575 [Candidatus Rokubacteria bacterium RIFCSPLOWO